MISPQAAVENSEIEALTQRHSQPLIVLFANFQEIVALATSCPSLFFDIVFAETIDTLRRLTDHHLAPLVERLG